MLVFACQINPIVGDLKGNTQLICHALSEAKEQGANLALFPELSICGYPPEDFLLHPQFLDEVEQALLEIAKCCQGLTAIVGTVRRSLKSSEKALYNSAAVIQNASIVGYQDKLLLPTYDVFDERRYFEPGESVQTWEVKGYPFAISICEDIWQHAKKITSTDYSKDPVQDIKALNVRFLVNLSSSPYSLNKVPMRLDVCAKAARFLQVPVILCNQVGGNDSLIFDGHSFCVDAQGKLTAIAKGFSSDTLRVYPEMQTPPISYTHSLEDNLYQALSKGLRDYFKKMGFQKACLGLSGGIDSAVVACIATQALGKENVHCISMPSRYSSEHSRSDAAALAKNLGTPFSSIPIEPIFQGYLDLLSPHFHGKPMDLTEENLQARIRGMILMALSNKHGSIVLGTGNKSEMAMGYSTLYGDMCGGLGVISDLNKKLVYKLASWINRDQEIIPYNTIRKPPSAELRPDQKDSDSLPDYEMIDHFLEEYLENHLTPLQIAEKYNYPISLMHQLMERVHTHEYKRRQSPPGLRVTEKAFSKGWHYPIVQKWV